MRILLASDFYPPTPGGLEGHVRRLAGALIRRGHEVAVVTATARPDPSPDGALIVPTATMLGRRAPWLFQDEAQQYPPPFPDATFRETIRHLADRWRPDVIHAHGWCAFSSYWHDSPPLVVTLHDQGLRCPKRTLLRGTSECVKGRGARCLTCTGGQSIVKTSALATVMGYSVPALVRHTHRFIAVSRFVAERAGELRGASPAIEVVPNFVDVGDTDVTASGDPARVLFVGPDSLHKGRPVLIDAFRRLPQKDVRLFLVGSNTRVNMTGITSLGYLRGAELEEQYRRASVVVVPSVCPEACPTVVLEAMSHARPVVASSIGGVTDLVEDGINGLLVAPNDSAALADALQRILSDHDLRERLIAGARVRAARFSTETVVPQIEEIYASAAAAPENPTAPTSGVGDGPGRGIRRGSVRPV